MFSRYKPIKPKKTPEETKKAADLAKTNEVSEKAAQSKAARKSGLSEGLKETEEFLNKDIQGLDPIKRQALQYEANKGIQRSQQAAERKLIGEQGRHGIVGKGGVGYAQRKDLHRMGAEAQGAVHRDLDKLNSDLALKKKAAIFAGGQGEAAQSQLDRQLALDELEHAEEKKRQRAHEAQMTQLFSRI